MTRSVVAVLHTTPETVLEDVRRAMLLCGGRSVLQERGGAWIEVETGRGVVRPGSRSTPWQLDAVCRQRPDFGTEDLIVMPRGALPWDASRGSALERLRRQHRLSLAGSDDPSAVAADPALALPLLTGRRGDLARVDPRREGRPAVLLPPLRSSRRWGLRGAVDLAVSTLGEEAERAEGEAAAELVAELLSLHAHLHPRTVALVDLTVCGAEDLRDRPSLHNLLLASLDPVAADAVAARLLGIEPTRLPWLRSCARRGLGEVDTAEIEVMGEDLEDLPEGILGGWWRGPSRRSRLGGWTSRLHRAVMAPLATRLTAGPLWRHYSRTPWGRLHEDYRKGEVRWA